MKQANQAFGKVVYAVIFLILIPSGLWFWAKYTETAISFPAIKSPIAGWILMSAGGLLMLWAMYFLKKFGKGLPMNAYPPSQFVTSGPYRLFHHPIYWGFAILMTGFFILSGSASGLWLVSPVTILGMIALVMGYEDPDLRERFPDQKTKTILDFPENTIDMADIRDRLASAFWLVSFLFIINFFVKTISHNTEPVFGKPLNFSTVINSQYTGLPGIIFLIAIPFFLKQKTAIRHWLIAGIVSLFCSFLIALIYPAFGAQYLSPGDLTLFSFPVVLVFISINSVFRQSVLIAIVFTLIAAILILLQLTNSRSVPVHFIESIILFFLSAFYHEIWIFLKNVTERIANSWREWTFGKIRVINHGFYVGAGAFVGVLLAGILAGKEYALALLIFNVIVTVCAALWAQIIEGSEKLKRPFGYYGGLVGIIFGSAAVWLMGYDVWVIIGVVSVAMPWVQAIGRLRCLVNGCCHGRRTDNPELGIRYTHPRSRVCNISGLKGELVHPTQLYSILWLCLVGILLLTLWINDFSCSFIFGIYLVLTSIGRFVEEAYRGEAQTPIIKGLRLYQWTAIASLIIGIIMTALQIEPAVIYTGFSWASVLVAAVTGFFIFFAMGVDFPYSNARFSRLV